MFATWQDLYGSDAQTVWLPLAAPLAYLIWRAAYGPPRRGGVLPAAARFIDWYAYIFAVETLIDPLATGPILRALDLQGGAATAVMVVFVLLGDLRVYLLLFALLAIAAGRRWQNAVPRAVGWTLLVPLIAYPSNAALEAVRASWDASSIWLIYEAAFCAIALMLRAQAGNVAAPLRDFLRAVLGYAALYYGLWAAADVLIQVAHVDVGWLLRIVPNQLYYGLWIPFVVWRFFAARYCRSNASTQASR